MATYNDDETFAMFMQVFLAVILALAISIPLADEKDSENIGIAAAVLSGIFVLLFFYKSLTAKPFEPETQTIFQERKIN